MTVRHKRLSSPTRRPIEQRVVRSPRPSAMPVRVLLIEDSPFDRELVRHALTRAEIGAPVQVVCAPTWNEAWPHVAEGKLDLILLDFLLPTMTGLDVLEELQLHPHPPVVIVSAQDDLPTALQTLRAGAHDYVLKSGDWASELCRAVERVLVRARLEQEFAATRARAASHAAELARSVETQRAYAQTRKREIEELYVQTEEMARMKMEIVANVSHELRTPLNSVLGYADLLEDHIPGDSATEARQLLGELRAQAIRLHAVVASVLSVERLRSAREPVTISRFSLAGIVDELRADAMILNADKGLTTTWVGPRRSTPVEHDRVKIRAIAKQLVSNAIKFTPAGSIHVTVLRTATGGVVIEVQDTGIGIPADARMLIFEDFLQLDGSSTRRYEGLGLGLGIVKRYTALLRGTVTAQDTLGGGTTVRIELPAPSARRKRLAAP